MPVLVISNFDYERMVAQKHTQIHVSYDAAQIMEEEIGNNVDPNPSCSLYVFSS